MSNSFLVVDSLVANSEADKDDFAFNLGVSKDKVFFASNQNDALEILTANPDIFLCYISSDENSAYLLVSKINKMNIPTCVVVYSELEDLV